MARPDLRFAVTLTLFLALVTAVLATQLQLPVRNHDGLPVPTYVVLPSLVVAALLLDVIPRGIRRARGVQQLGSSVATVVQERWGPGPLRFLILGTVVAYACNSAFRNLKSFVPFANDRLWDASLERMDSVLFVGNDPATMLHQALGTGWAAHVLSLVYVSWLALIPVTLGVALVWTRRTNAASWYLSALILNWVLGLVAYFSVPSLGPVYSAPERFDRLPDTYVTSLQQSMLTDRADMLADPWGTPAVQPIAAFASLHVGVVVSMVVLAHLLALPRWVRVTGWWYLALTVVATVYLGWHYVADDLGGVLVGLAAVWLAALGTGNHVRGRPRLVEPAALPEPAPVAEAAQPRTSRNASA